MAARMGVWLSSNRHAEAPDEEKNIIKNFNLSSWGLTRLKFLKRHFWAVSGPETIILYNLPLNGDCHIWELQDLKCISQLHLGIKL